MGQREQAGTHREGIVVVLVVLGDFDQRVHKLSLVAIEHA